MVTILDGGMGSTLEARGVDVNNPLWGSVVLLDDDGLALNDQIHREFVEAGAAVVIANTHNLSLAHCAAHGAEDPRDLMRRLHVRALESARRAGPKRVAGCLASPDTPYATTPSLSADEVEAKIRPQVDVLTALDFDVVFYEMMTTSADLEGVARVASGAFAVGLPCGEDGRTLGGVDLGEVVAMFEHVRPETLFVQCTRFELVDRALERLLAAAPSDVEVGVYANDGRHWADGCWHGAPVAPGDYADAAMRWVRMGATIVGGCCGTGPEHIAALAERLRVI